MNIHWKIWIPGILSLIAYVVADSSGHPGAWYAVWGVLQIVAAYYTWILLRDYKHRSGAWVGLVLVSGLLGIIIIYLIPAKKVIPTPPNAQV